MTARWETPDHVLVAGGTKSGKTTYVIKYCHAMKRRGFEVLWFTAIPDPRLAALTQFVTHDKAQMLKWMKTHGRCVCVFDEGGSTVGRYDPEIEVTATQGRHPVPGRPGAGEHTCIYICQAARQISPTIRGMCGVLVCFRVDVMSAELLSRDFVEPKAELAPQLQQFEYLRIERFKPIQKGRLTL